jgi:hypothetical protein
MIKTFLKQNPFYWKITLFCFVYLAIKTHLDLLYYFNYLFYISIWIVRNEVFINSFLLYIFAVAQFVAAVNYLKYAFKDK